LISILSRKSLTLNPNLNPNPNPNPNPSPNPEALTLTLTLTLTLLSILSRKTPFSPADGSGGAFEAGFGAKGVFPLRGSPTVSAGLRPSAMASAAAAAAAATW
jgi:hypothetical protein